VTPRLLLHAAISPALSLLDAKLDSIPARAMLIAIALQESGLKARVQVLDAGKDWWESRPGPAHSFWQFEAGGVSAVLGNNRTRQIVDPVLAQMAYPRMVTTVHDAVTHNDVLAAVFARALLYSAPWALPAQNAPEEGWRQYLWAWRPGKPHEGTWKANYAAGWAAVLGG
jgi:hypothetical protein